jgi:hypothetical protein
LIPKITAFKLTDKSHLSFTIANKTQKTDKVKEILDVRNWSASACMSEAEIPLCEADAVFRKPGFESRFYTLTPNSPRVAEASCLGTF